MKAMVQIIERLCYVFGIVSQNVTLQMSIECFLITTGTTCPLPGLLDNGVIEPLGQLYFCGTTVTFSCDQGYMLNGTGTNSSMCTVNGTWTEEFPTCEGVFN